jgi:hypothetical protein
MAQLGETMSFVEGTHTRLVDGRQDDRRVRNHGEHLLLALGQREPLHRVGFVETYVETPVLQDRQHLPDHHDHDQYQRARHDAGIVPPVLLHDAGVQKQRPNGRN